MFSEIRLHSMIGFNQDIHDTAAPMEFAIAMLRLIFILTFMSPSLSKGTFYTGYEHCIFNLVDSETSTRERADMTERILHQNQGSHLWTLTTLSSTTKVPEDDPIVDSGFLRESCSVNVVIALEPDQSWDLFNVFGFRFYSSKNTLLIFQSRMVNFERSFHFGTPFFTVIDVFILVLSNDGRSLDGSVCYCPSCPTISIEQFTPRKSLYEMKEISTHLKLRSLYPAVVFVKPLSTSTIIYADQLNVYGLPCTFRNLQQRPIVDLTFFGVVQSPLRCTTPQRFLDTIADKLNFSVSYFISDLKTVILQQNYFRTIALLGDDTGSKWYEGSPMMPINRLFYQFLYNDQSYKFLYCTRHIERESFSILFYTVPFDLWSWAGIGAALVILTLFLREKWTNILGILVRQASSKRKNLLVLLMLMSIVITCCYESIVSGFLTVPPPVITFNSLKGLIDAGYKMLDLEDAERDMWKLEDVFRRENITSHSLQSSLIPGPELDLWTEDEIRDGLLACNSTVAIPSSNKYETYIALNPHNETNTKCYLTSRAPISQTVLFTFTGHDYVSFGKGAQFLTESGIMQMYDNVNYYFVLFQKKKRDHYENYILSQPVAFNLSDWKVGSIFCGWIFLVFFSGFVFSSELFRGQIINSFDKLLSLVKVTGTIFYNSSRRCALILLSYIYAQAQACSYISRCET